MFKGKTLASLVAALALVGGCGGERAGRDVSTPSGFAVPRYLMLRFGEINARAGPSEDHARLWTYHAKGMPVQVIAETKEWRRICDPEGGISWVASRMLEGGDGVIRIKPGTLPLRRSASPASGVVASLAPRGLAHLDRCENGWCRVKVGRAVGWAPMTELWGADPAVQCAGLPAPAAGLDQGARRMGGAGP